MIFRAVFNDIKFTDRFSSCTGSCLNRERSIKIGKVSRYYRKLVSGSSC